MPSLLFLYEQYVALGGMSVAAGDTKLRVNNTENAKQIKQYYFYVQFWRNFTETNEVYKLLLN